MKKIYVLGTTNNTYIDIQQAGSNELTIYNVQNELSASKMNSYEDAVEVMNSLLNDNTLEKFYFEYSFDCPKPEYIVEISYELNKIKEIKDEQLF